MSNSSGNWFSRLFKQVSQAEPKQDPDAVPKPAAEQKYQTGAIYKKGDFIGQKYEVYRVLGKGGFGIVLYQIAAGGRLPFPVSLIADYWQGMKRLHRETPVPRLDSPLYPIHRRCLEKRPEKRYRAFEEVRKDLEELLLH